MVTHSPARTVDHEAGQFIFHEHRRDQRDIGQVRPAQIGGVQDHHAAEMHRDVRGLGTKIPPTGRKRRRSSPAGP